MSSCISFVLLALAVTNYMWIVESYTGGSVTDFSVNFEVSQSFRKRREATEDEVSLSRRRRDGGETEPSCQCENTVHLSRLSATALKSMEGHLFSMETTRLHDPNGVPVYDVIELTYVGNITRSTCQEENTDFVGHAISASKGVQSWEKCAQKCDMNDACKFWVYASKAYPSPLYAQGCWLKSSKWSSKYHKEVTSGVKGCRGTPKKKYYLTSITNECDCTPLLHSGKVTIFGQQKNDQLLNPEIVNTENLGKAQENRMVNQTTVYKTVVGVLGGGLVVLIIVLLIIAAIMVMRRRKQDAVEVNAERASPETEKKTEIAVGVNNASYNVNSVE